MKQVRQGLYVVVVLLSGCSSLTEIPESYYDSDRQSDYPLIIVSARYQPEIKIKIPTSGKAVGTATGAAAGAGACAGLVTINPYLLPLALACMPLGLAGGATLGGANTEKAAKTRETITKFQANLARLRKQDQFAKAASSYLTSVGISAKQENDAFGPATPEAMPGYPVDQFKDYGSILELRILELKIRGSNKKRVPACLTITLAARKIDARSGREIDRFQYGVDGGCKLPGKWMQDDGKVLLEAIRSGYSEAASAIVDELYLMHYPRTEARRQVTKDKLEKQKASGDNAPHVASPPTFVLSPINPPLVRKKKVNLLTEIYSKAPKYKTGYGGLGMASVETLSPRFEWEAFPRKLDQAPGASEPKEISDVVYDFKVYSGILANEITVVPDQTVYSRYGLKHNYHQLEEKLSYCGWYFWTVRARYHLNGVPRITEWAGAYDTGLTVLSPGAERRFRAKHSAITTVPFSVFYYPLRTPADPEWPECWNKKKVFEQRLRAKSAVN